MTERYVVSEPDSEVHEGWTGIEVGVDDEGMIFIEEVRPIGNNKRIFVFGDEVGGLTEALRKAVGETDSPKPATKKRPIQEKGEKWNVGVPYDANEEEPR